MFCILAYRSNSTRKVCPHIDFPIFPNFPNQKERKRDDDDDYLCNTDWHDQGDHDNAPGLEETMREYNAMEN